MNWKKLPLKEVSFSILKSRNNKYRGLYRIAIWKSSLGYGRTVNKGYFKTKADLLEFIDENFDSALSWIEEG